MSLLPCALSVLDVSPVLSGGTPASALQDTVALARAVDALGYKRFWLAEHHNMGGIASSSPEIIIAHAAMATQRIRVGSGGVMLPNHAALKIAETFLTLEAFHPGRIDLGLGRAPGTGERTAVALRGSTEAVYSDNFPEQLIELEAFLGGGFPAGHPFERIQAMPTGTAAPPIYILGSSDFGARLAAERGMPYAFAQHFSPLPASEILGLYQTLFQPSKYLERPYSMVAISAVVAESDSEAQELSRSAELAFHDFRRTGDSRPLPTVADARLAVPDERAWRHIRAERMPRFVGSPTTVGAALSRLVESSRIDELIVLTMVHDQAARRRSYELLRTLAD